MKRLILAVMMTSAAGLVHAAMKGEQVYNMHCVACHGSGVAGAPKHGDKAAWAPRLKQGEAVLFQHAKNGFKAMPAMGTCSECTDEELKKAIQYNAH